jgi:hypothetical protein
VARCLRLEADSLGYLDTRGVRLGTDSAEPYGSERLDALPGGFQLLAPPQTIFTVDFEDPADIASLLAGRVSSVSFPVNRPGRLDCLAGWFVLHLGSGQTLRTGPGEGGCWEQAVFRPPAPGPQRSVRPGQAVMAEFLVRKHVALQRLEVEADGDAKEENGMLDDGRPAATFVWRQLLLPPACLALLSCPQQLALAQWLAYRLASDRARPCRLLHTAAALPPLALLQTALLRGPGAASLTLAVDPAAAPGQGRQMLDWVTAVAGANSIPVSAIDCITGLGPAAGAAYTAAVVAPVLPSGRLDQVFTNTGYQIPNIAGSAAIPALCAGGPGPRRPLAPPRPGGVGGGGGQHRPRHRLPPHQRPARARLQDRGPGEYSGGGAPAGPLLPRPAAGGAHGALQVFGIWCIWYLGIWC